MAQQSLRVFSSTATVALTGLGADDWATWDDATTTGAPGNRKAGGRSLISNAAIYGSGAFGGYNNDPRTLSWTDGTPTASASSTDGNYNDGFAVGCGYQLTFPADQNTREARVYLGYYSVAVVKVTAFLNDGSGTLIDTSLPGSGNGASACGYVVVVYNATRPGQTLTVRVEVLTGESGASDPNVTICGAAVKTLSAPSGFRRRALIGADTGTGGAATISPTGIAGAEAFGSPALSVTISPTGLASAEAFGTPSAVAVLSPTGIATAEAFGTPIATPAIGATGIASAEAFGTPALSVTVSPSGIASAEAFGTPTVGGVPADVLPSGIASAEAFGAPALSVNVAPSGIASAEAFGSPSLAATVSPAGIATGEAFGAPTVGGVQTIAPTGIASAEVMGTPALSVGIAPAGIGSQEAFGSPTVTMEGPVSLIMVGIPSEEAFGIPQVGDITPAVETRPGSEIGGVDYNRRRAPRHPGQKPLLQRILEARYPKVRPANDRKAKRAKAIEIQAAELVVEGADEQDLLSLLQRWQAQNPVIPPRAQAIEPMQLFLAQVAFRIRQQQLDEPTDQDDEDAILALLLA